MRAAAFSPGHITGFVQFPIAREDPMQNGSLGAGFSISKGVRTSVELESAANSDCYITINGRPVNDAEVSRYVVKEYLSRLDRSYRVIVDHRLEIPVGYGLGSSGAAALSLSYALNEALGAPLSKTEAGQIAHKADLACKCGAGTVLAEFHGGFEMRLAPGAPGVGVVEKIPLLERKAVMVCLAPVSTRDFLTNKIQFINGLGGKMLSRLKKSRSADDFMEMSSEFAGSLGFMSKRCKAVVDGLTFNGHRCSMAMFGETVFSLVRDDEVQAVQKILRKYGDDVLVCDIDSDGARLC
jgi:pantoate kinase